MIKASSTLLEYMIYSDMWGLDVNLENFNEYAIFIITYYKEKIILTNSLADFIARFLKGGVFEIGGLYAWTDEIKAKLYGNTDPYEMKLLLWVYRETLKRGLMTKQYVVQRADWIIATENAPHHFFIEMSLSHDLNGLITVLTSIGLEEDIMQVRAFFSVIDTRLIVNKLTIDHVISIINSFSHDERLTVYERKKIMELIVDFDYLQDSKFKMQLENKLHENIKDFFNNYIYFNLYYYKDWNKTNTKLVNKFEHLAK